ncbi:MAG: potassium channel protein [Acidobacteria bacterium]|nr:potassium channel protein [Acidobacteriota bacterium]
MLTAVFLMLAIVVVGTGGFRILMGWSLVDSLYMTLTTLTTIGFGEIHPMGVKGRVFTIGLLLVGVGTALYVLTLGAQVLVEGHVRNLFRRRKMERAVSRLENHVIICGYGRMGRIVGEELRARGVPFVVIEGVPELARKIQDDDLLVIEGDATRDETLRQAGVERARAIACVVDSDAKNLYITLSARVLNRKIFILSRCAEESAEEKLRRAGADKVIFPYRAGARQIANTIIHPNVTEFMEMISQRGSIQLEMREFTLPAGSFLDGVPLRKSKLRETYNLMVVGIRRSGGESMLFNPATDLTLEAGNILMILGKPENADRLMTDLKV